MVELLHSETTGKVLRAYFDVYNGLSHTFSEHIFENAMMREMQRLGLRCSRQDEYQIYYKEWLVGLQRLDILVAEEVVVELKVKPSLTNLDEAQLLSYLWTLRREVGLLLNFGSHEPDYRRRVLTTRASRLETMPDTQERDGLLFPDLTDKIIAGLYEVRHELGVGFVHRIYANACYWEMQARGLAVQPCREMAVFYHSETIGTVKLMHLLIEGCVMLFPVALAGARQMEEKNLRAWMASQGVQLGILANFQAESFEPVFMRV